MSCTAGRRESTPSVTGIACGATAAGDRRVTSTFLYESRGHVRGKSDKTHENRPDFANSHRHAEVTPFAPPDRMRKLRPNRRNTILVIHEDQSTRDRIVETLDTEGPWAFRPRAPRMRCVTCRA